MSKNISFNTEKLVKGMNIAADAVGGTIGPKGRNVFVGDIYTPKITNDGATIANKVILNDSEEDAGAYVIRNVSAQQLDDVGDGTTTVTVLTQSIINECLKRPENVMEIKESLKKAGANVLDVLSKKSIKLSKTYIKKVALISAEDETLASLITEIIDKLGDNAVINVEDSKTFGTEYEIVDGFEIPFGYMAPYASFGKLTYINVPVLVIEDRISNPSAIDGIFMKLAEKKIRSCVIACNEIEDMTLGVLGINKVKGAFDSVVIRMNSQELQNIAGATGATIVSATSGVTFQNLDLEHLGTAQKVICDAHKTVVMGDKEISNLYASRLKLELDNEPNQYLKKKLEDRIAKMRGGVAVLKIGAPTDQEREYLKDKADDAIKATLAAIEEGIVEGGGMCLWRIAQELKENTIGEQILKKSLCAPFKRIIENAGKDYAEVLMNMPKGKGYDSKNNAYVDMVKEGIVDPSKVERCAVENAVSAASTFITTSCVITYNETN